MLAHPSEAMARLGVHRPPKGVQLLHTQRERSPSPTPKSTGSHRWRPGRLSPSTSCSALWLSPVSSAAHRTLHSRRRPTTPTPSISDNRHERHHPDLPTRRRAEHQALLDTVRDPRDPAP